MTWHDTREIGELLFEQYDTLDPLTVRFTDLLKWVLNLEGFEGKPDGSRGPEGPNARRSVAIIGLWIRRRSATSPTGTVSRSSFASARR